MKVINVEVNNLMRFDNIYDTDNQSSQSITAGVKIPTGNYNDILLNFNFISPVSAQTGLRLFAVFKADFLNNAIEVEITSNTISNITYAKSCFAPHEIFEHVGKVSLGIYGYIMNGETLQKRLSLIPIPFVVVQGSYDENATTSITPTPTVFEVYFDKIVKAENDLEQYINTKTAEYNSFQEEIESEVESFVAQYNGKPFVFDNVTAMKQATLKNGDNAITLGYYSANDGGGATYKIRTKTSEDTEDGIYIHYVGSSLVAELIDTDIYKDNIKSESFYDNTSSTTYYITEIPYRDKFGKQNKWQIGVANDNITELNKLESTINFASRKNASICINAGLFQMSTGVNKPHGVFIQNGVILQDELPKTSFSTEILGIKENGEFVNFPSESTSAQDVLDSGCINALVGYKAIIKNGVAIESETVQYPRQILCRKTNGDYLILTCDGKTKYDLGMTISDCQRILNNYNIDFAFRLDEGGSTSTVIDIQKINKNIDDQYTDRKVNSFLYIKKEIIKENDLNNIYSIVSNLRQTMIKNNINIKDIWSGYLKLYAPDNTPGIEFYEKNEVEERSAKLYANYYGLYFYKRAEKGADYKASFTVTDTFVSHNGIPFGLFNDYCSNTASETDFNNINKAGIYLATKNSSNIPKDGNFMIIHMNSSSSKTNMSQFAFPLSGTNGYIYCRRVIDGTDWTDWVPINIFISTSSNRPTTSIANGTMYFDTTLKKPIWYYNNNWYDGNGNIV